MPHGARPRSAHRAPALPAPTHRGRRRGSREVAHSCRPGGTMRASYVPTGLGPRTPPPGHRPRNAPPLACASRGCSARPRPPGRPGATVVTRALRARPEDRGPRGVRGRVARGTAAGATPSPDAPLCPLAPNVRRPRRGPGARVQAHLDPVGSSQPAGKAWGCPLPSSRGLGCPAPALSRLLSSWRGRTRRGAQSRSTGTGRCGLAQTPGGSATRRQPPQG